MIEQIFDDSILGFFIDLVQTIFSLVGSLGKLLVTVFNLVITFVSYLFYLNPVITVCFFAAMAFGLVYGLLKFVNQIPFV